MYVGWLVEGRKSLPSVPFQTIVYKSYRLTWDELAELEVELTFCIHTCQCCVIEFHTPILPVWLVATSWLPIKNNASTGTLRLNVPANKQCQSSMKREARRAWRVMFSKLALCIPITFTHLASFVSRWMKFYHGVTIKIKGLKQYKQYFHKVLLIKLYKQVLTCEFVDESVYEILCGVTHSNETFPAVLSFLSKVLYN